MSEIYEIYHFIANQTSHLKLVSTFGPQSSVQFQLCNPYFDSWEVCNIRVLGALRFWL